MITFNYKHTQQKQRLESIFNNELSAFLNDSITLILVEFKLTIDEKLRTKEEIVATILMDQRKVLFRAQKGRFKHSAISVIEEVKRFLIQNSAAQSA
ncbi:MAG: hypothetical protein ACSHWW_06460 [Nonlabens sp.]|uniref:hypothetical protein n=1 Tax=Nonlabens sp. TaxID=1888209 RepID=UPI003EF974C1